ncbi:hypothetical protein FACS189479_07650 [Spirochaetia bacterium]|nr:hypothetical protein FACS189479_07650 [Spirochaetia bacterium]
MTTETLLSQIAIALILFGSIFYLFHKHIKGVSKELPKIVFGFSVFSAGLMLNWAGLNYFYREAENPGRIFNFGTILSTTLKMFGFNWERAVWSPLATKDPFFGSAITLCYIAAAIFSSSFILQILSKIFGNFVNSLSLFYRTHFAEKMWIIAGKGVHQKTLLESLTPEQKKNTILILKESSEEAKKEYLAQDFSIINEKISVEILKKAGLFGSRETALIAISDDDVENLEIARTITEHLKKPTNHETLNFTARIMYTNIERTEHFKFSGTAGGRIQFFNPYEITARSFLFDKPITKFIPPEYINTEKARLNIDGFKFLHVFIGFGKANRELLKQSIAANQILGMDYHALVIDSSLGDSESVFKNHSPGLFANEAERDDTRYFPIPKEKYHIEFFECNALSKEMYDTVIDRVKGANASVVIVSLGNVQLNVETAMEIRQRCYEESIGINETHIFVRAKRQSPMVADDVLNEKELKDKNEIKIHAFGFQEKILTLDRIVNMDTDLLAKHIAASYADTGIKDQWKNKDELNRKWGKIDNFKRESNLNAALSIRIKLNMMGLDLVYNNKDIPDAGEEFKLAYGFEQVKKLRAVKEMEHDTGGNIADTIRNNLARLEHQRWNTFHLVKGWTPLPKNMVSAESRQNKRTKKHACITTFEGLKELAILEAELKCKADPGLDFDIVLKESDTMHYDCDQMDCLIGNIIDTNYRIVKKV